MYRKAAEWLMRYFSSAIFGSAREARDNKKSAQIILNTFSVILKNKFQSTEGKTSEQAICLIANAISA